MEKSSIDVIKKHVDIKLIFEGPSDWSIREYINVIREYLMERLPIILNNTLESLGLEASIREDLDGCKILSKPGCEKYLVVEIYESSSNSVCCYILYRENIGDNTYEFILEDIVLP